MFRTFSTLFLAVLLSCCSLGAEQRPELFLTPKGKDTSVETAARIVNGFGTILRYDKESRYYIVRLLPHFTLKDAYARLAKKNVDVKLHDGEVELRTDENGDSEPDIWEMREWYLKRRRDDKGKIDWSSYGREIAHRAAMPTGRIGRQVTVPGVLRPNLVEGNWSFIGPQDFTGSSGRTYFGVGDNAGRINAVAYDPTDENTIYIGAASGGVWKTTNGGTSWTPLTDGWPMLQVSSIAIDPTDHNKIYVGTGDYPGAFGLSVGSNHGNGYGIGVMKSTDGGAHWDTSVSASSSAVFGDVCVSNILISPEHPDTIIVTTGHGTDNVGGVYRSINGGVSWNNTGLPAQIWTSAAVGPKPASTRNFYVASGKPDMKAFYSSNEGATWTAMPLPGTISLPDTFGSLVIAASVLNADTAYLMVNDKNGGSFWKTSNKGSTWTNITGNFPNGDGTTKGALYNWSQAFYNYFLGAFSWFNTTTNSYQESLVAGNIDVNISLAIDGRWGSIGGPSFSSTANIHNDQHAIAFSPTNTRHFVVGNDGGLYSYDVDLNAGSFTVTSLNKSLGISQLYSVAVHPTKEYRVMAGAQDNGTPATYFDSVDTSTFSKWFHTPSGGDGSFVAYYKNAPQIMYCGNEKGKIYETRDGGSNWTKITPLSGTGNAQVAYLGEPTAWIAPIAVDNTNGLLYLGTDHLWRYSIGAQAWSEVSGDLTGDILTALAVSDDGARIYAGTGAGEVLMSTDGGANFSPINGDLPWGARTISAISISPDSNKDILITSSSVGQRNIQRCNDTTTGTPHWIDVAGPDSGSTTLVKSPVNAIARDFDTPGNTWYVGTDVGMFMTNDSGATWSNITQPLGLPNVQINALFAHPQSRYLYAATYGRGVWRIHNKAVGLTLDFSKNPIAKGQTTTATVAVDTPAPSGGMVVKLNSSDAGVAVPASVTIPSGKLSVSFDITPQATMASGIVTIGAMLGEVKVYKDLQVITPVVKDMTLTPGTVWGGSQNSTWTINLQGPVQGPDPVTITFSSSDPSAAKPDYDSLKVNPGYSSTQVNVTTFPVSAFTDVTLTASYVGGSSSIVLHVQPNRPKTFTLSSYEVWGGSEHPTATVVLDYFAATVGGTTVATQNLDRAACTIPETITIPSGGYNTGTYNIHTKPVSTVHNVEIDVACNGAHLSAILKIKPNQPAALNVPKNVVTGGTENLACSVKLMYFAGTDAGTDIALKSSNPAALSVPASVHVPVGGYDSMSFTATTYQVSANSAVTLSATANGGTIKTVITVNANQPSSLTVSPAPVYGGVSNPTGTVTLQDFGAYNGGTTVTLSSSVPAAASVPASVLVNAGGYNSATFTVTTYPVSADVTVSIRATANGGTKSFPLLVKANQPASLTLSDSIAWGGATNVNGTVVLKSQTGGIETFVNLASSNSSAASVPASVKVSAGGYNSATFTVTTAFVSVDTSVTISATTNGGTLSQSLLVKRLGVSSVITNAPSVVGGSDVGGSVTIEHTTGNNAMPITIGTSAPTVASPAVSPVNVPAGGYTTVGFNLHTQPVATTKTLTVSATTNGSTKSCTLIVDTIALTGMSISPSPVKGGLSAVATFTLAAEAPLPMRVLLSDDASFVVTSSYVDVPQGATKGTFNVITYPTASDADAHVTAKLGRSSVTATVRVLAPSLKSITLKPTSVIGGNTVTGTANLFGSTGAFTKTVALTSSNTAVATVPASVTVPQKGYLANFPIPTVGVDTNTNVTITGTMDGLNQSATLTVRPAVLTTLKSPVTDTGGGFVINAIAALNGQAGPNGAVISLRNSNPAVASVPATVTVPFKSTYVKVPIATNVVATNSSTIVTATYGSVSRSVVLKIHPALLVRVTTSASSVKGGTALTGTVNLDGQAGAGGVTVQISTSDGHVVIVSPITIPAGKSGTSFSISTKAVSATTTVTITATAGSATASTQLQLTP